MTKQPVSKLDQYALIALIAKRCSEKGRLGKKAGQKMVHLLQELGSVDAGYDFSFYTYGPYSTGLAGDMDVAAAWGGIEVTYNSSDNFYLIEPGAASARMIHKGQAFLERNRDGIDRVLSTFGGRLAKDLELVSTVAFVRRHGAAGEFDDDTRLAARVKALKPQYSGSEIARAIEEVKSFLRRDPTA